MNVFFLTDTAGNKAAEYLLDSYGNIAYSQGASVNSYLWRTLPYDSSIESYQQAGSIYSSKNNKLLNAGYQQQQSEDDKPDIPEDRINFTCGCKEKEAQKDAIKDRINDIYQNYLKVASGTPITGTVVAHTSCDGLIHTTGTIHWRNPWGSDRSCLNCAAKYHEKVHCSQCENNGKTWYLYYEALKDVVKVWNNREYDAYQTEMNVLNSMLKEKDKVNLTINKIGENQN